MAVLVNGLWFLHTLADTTEGSFPQAQKGGAFGDLSDARGALSPTASATSQQAIAKRKT
jgi:hypothetical protein